jgi:hypothetical protein
MSFDINIPSVIQGTVPQPIMYGRSACAQYMSYLKAVQDHYNQTGDNTPLDQLCLASVRYTPEGTISKGMTTEEAIQNALGYAAADIQQFDSNGDRALNRQELRQIFLAPFQSKLDALSQILQSPQVTEADKQTVSQLQDELINIAATSAANYMAAVDTPDPVTGQPDGLITADEAAAKLLFDDGAKQMFEDNKEAYQTIIDGLQAKTDYDGPSFEQLQQTVNAITASNPNSPFLLDGQLTAGEQELGDVLNSVPIPTNQIISQIHQSLRLKERLAEINPFMD